MLRKTKKVISIACVLIFILPIMSYSMDKEEFLKFLIESSYPESSTKDDNSKEKEDEVDKTANKEEDYIKVHIGEENIPTLNSNSNNKENVSVASSEYKNDIRLTKENPTMLIYHSHAGETYSDSPEGNYHSQNKEKSVIEVGTLLTEQLSKKGWGIAHSTKYHDYPDFTKSYISSLETVKSMLNTHKSINIAIEAGIDKNKIVLDPGIGFGKTYEQNLEVLKRLGELKTLGYPILLGTSRKSVIGNTLDLPPQERVEGTIATTVLGIRDGVDIVRVHDVEKNLRAAKMADAIYRG